MMTQTKPNMWRPNETYGTRLNSTGIIKVLV